MSNIRIVKGSAVYNAAFTPPTAPLTAISGTSTLLSATNAGIRDETAKNNMTTYGTAAVSTTQSKFGGSSFLINDGDSNLVTIPHNKLLNLDSGDFTIEFWVYLTQNASSYNFVISKGTSNTREWAVNVGPGTIRFYWSTNGSADSVYSVTPASIPLSTWMHIAVVRSSTNLYIFKDGTQVGSTGTFTSMYAGTNVVNIGRFMDYTGISHSMFGYIDDLRITKYARYTANFTPTTLTFPDR
jgi:Cu/Ag efflux protein CusF